MEGEVIRGGSTKVGGSLLGEDVENSLFGETTNFCNNTTLIFVVAARAGPTSRLRVHTRVHTAGQAAKPHKLQRLWVIGCILGPGAMFSVQCLVFSLAIAHPSQ